MHLGKKASTVQAQVAATRAVQTYGLPTEVDPHDALLAEVHRTAGHVKWLAEVVAGLEQGDLVWGVTGEVDRDAGAFPGVDVTRGSVPSVWLDLYHRERSHLVKVCAAAIAAGIDERRVQIAEAQGAAIVAIIRATLTDLGIEVTPEVAQTVGRHLRAV